MRRTYTVMGLTPPAFADHWREEEQGSGADQPLPLSRQRRRPRRVLVGGKARAGLIAMAALLLVLVVGPMVGPMLDPADLASPATERRMVTLEDGSTVVLGPDSAIDVAMTVDRREITLRRGTAFFQVTPNRNRPFVVKTAALDCQVLGTRFEVDLSRGETRVAVREGRVRVDVRREEAPFVDLIPGDWVETTGQGRLVRGTQPPGLTAAWVDGQLVVNDRPVAEVVGQIERYLGGTVLLHGDGLSAAPLTGVYSLADPMAALRAVASAHGAEVYRLTPWLVILSR